MLNRAFILRGQGYTGVLVVGRWPESQILGPLNKNTPLRNRVEREMVPFLRLLF